MKRLLLLTAAVAATLSVKAQGHKPEKLWETDTIVAVPESVLPDAKNKRLFVSLIDGNPTGKDGKGGIATLSQDGKTYNGTWLTGLNAPKGMAMLGGKLYVTDIDEFVVIDIATAKVDAKVSVKGAQFLNDVTTDGKATVYFSDMATGIIYKWEKNTYKPFLTKLAGVNGLSFYKGELYFIVNDVFKKTDAAGKITDLAKIGDKSGDGVEPIGNGDWLISAWNGHVYYVDKAGKATEILDNTPVKKNTADIGYDPASQTLYIPTFFGKTVQAFKVK